MNSNNTLFYDAAKNGDLEIVQNMVNNNNDTIYMEDINHAFKLAYENGYLNVAEWLYLFKANIDTSANNKYVFVYTCSNGYLNMAKWLYEIKPDIDISFESNYAFRTTCYNGHLNVAKWLCEIKPNINTSYEHEHAFIIACTKLSFECCKMVI